jgi:DNA-damage-inducible protein J
MATNYFQYFDMFHRSVKVALAIQWICVVNKTAITCTRIEPRLKNEVESILAELELTASETVHLLYRQIKLQSGLSFDMRIPNALTTRTLNASKSGRNVKRFTSKEALFADTTWADENVQPDQPVQERCGYPKVRPGMRAEFHHYRRASPPSLQDGYASSAYHQTLACLAYFRSRSATTFVLHTTNVDLFCFSVSDVAGQNEPTIRGTCLVVWWPGCCLSQPRERPDHGHFPKSIRPCVRARFSRSSAFCPDIEHGARFRHPQAARLFRRPFACQQMLPRRAHPTETGLSRFLQLRDLSWTQWPLQQRFAMPAWPGAQTVAGSRQPESSRWTQAFARRGLRKTG